MFVVRPHRLGAPTPQLGQDPQVLGPQTSYGVAFVLFNQAQLKQASQALMAGSLKLPFGKLRAADSGPSEDGSRDEPPPIVAEPSNFSPSSPAVCGCRCAISAEEGSRFRAQQRQSQC